MKHLAPVDSQLWVVAQKPFGHNPFGPRGSTHWDTGAQEPPAPGGEEKEEV